MELFKRKFLLIPLLILLVVFGLDKIFLIPAVKDRTQLWNKVEPPFYESRAWLFEQLQGEYRDFHARGDKLGLILGSSRAGEFNKDDIADLIPGARTYNFSAPLAPPSFHYYWFDKILNDGMKVDFVIMELDPLILGQEAIRYSLAYSYDPIFMVKHTELNRDRPRQPPTFAELLAADNYGFSFDEVETYFLKQLFALYKYPPNSRAFKENFELNIMLGGTGLDFRRQMMDNINIANQVNLGGIPNPMVVQSSPEMIARAAEEAARRFLYNFQAAPTQVVFVKKLLQRMAENGIKVVIYWPVVSAPYYQISKSEGHLETVQKPLRNYLKNLANSNPDFFVELIDLNESERMNCRHFLDSYHLSGKCYRQLTELLLENMKRDFK